MTNTCLTGLLADEVPTVEKTLKDVCPSGTRSPESQTLLGPRLISHCCISKHFILRGLFRDNLSQSAVKCSYIVPSFGEPVVTICADSSHMFQLELVSHDTIDGR